MSFTRARIVRDLRASLAVALASAGVVLLAQRATASTLLQAAASCTPDWLPAFGGTSAVDHTVFALAVFDDGGGPALYAGGEFLTAGGAAANRIAKWNGTSWSALGSGVGGAASWVNTLAVFDGGGGPALYAGGVFTTAGGASANRIARWNGASWSALGGGVDGGSSPRVQALAAFDDGGGPALFVAGDFASVDGLAVPALHIAKWDGASWSAVGTGMDSAVHALGVFDDGGGPALYAGGNFATAGGVAASRIAKWDGATWSALGSGVDASVFALAAHDDGSGTALYAGGAFTGAGGSLATRIARWNGASWSHVGGGVDWWVNALAVFDDGNGAALFAGGYFSEAGGLLASQIARWDGASWSSLGAGLNGGSTPAVLALSVFDDGSGPALYAGGGFVSSPAGDIHLAKWDCPIPTSGSVFCTAGTTTNGCVPALGGAGSASASTGSGFTLTVANVEGQRSGLLFYGLSGGQFLPWSATSASFLCVKSPTQRMSPQGSGGTLNACDGSFAQDWNAYVATHPSALGQVFAGGETVWAQAWFRDPPAPKTTNLSDGLVFLVAP